MIKRSGSQSTGRPTSVSNFLSTFIAPYPYLFSDLYRSAWWSSGFHKRVFVVAAAGHLEVVKLLVSQGSDKSCKDKRGYTPLHAAAASGHVDVVKYLLRSGAEVSYAAKAKPCDLNQRDMC